MPADEIRRSALLFALPLLAVGAGAAAVLIGGTVPPLPPTPAGGLSPDSVTYADAGIVVGVALLGLVGFWIFQRIRGAGASLPGRFAVSCLVVMILAILFLVAVSIVHPTTPGTEPSTGTPTNATPSPVVSNATQNGTTRGTVPFPDVGPWWAPYALLAGAAVLAGAIALWMAGASNAAPTTLPAPRPPAAGAIRAALDALGGVPGDDPRGRILLAYATLLGAVGDRAGALDAVTARELSDRLTERLGVTRGTATELTHLFEEARYSTRPIGDDAADRARAALTRALEELRPRGLAK